MVMVRVRVRVSLQEIDVSLCDVLKNDGNKEVCVCVCEEEEDEIYQCHEAHLSKCHSHSSTYKPIE